MADDYNTIGAEWRKFAKAALPIDASQVQRSEMEFAFYAGALSLIKLLRTMPAGLSNDASGAMIAAWRDEAGAFLTAHVGRKGG